MRLARARATGVTVREERAVEAQEVVISDKVTRTQGKLLAGAIVALQALNLAVSTNASGTTGTVLR